MAADMRSGKSIIYSSTSGGIRKSLDGGATWTMAKTGNSKEVKVAVDGMVIAQSASTIVKSTDEGTTWTTITPPNVGISRASIAISPQDPNYVYIMVSGNDSKLVGVFRTKDAGSSWEQIVAASSNYFDPLISLASSQGYYNNVVTVNPLDKNHIIMGGVTLAEWREGNNPKYIASLNDFGGANPAYVHADKHVLQWDMSTTPPTLICGNDGGLFFSSDNARTFTAKNQGFNATQFYAVAADYMGNVVGGTQDNGTQYINKKGNTKKAAVEIEGQLVGEIQKGLLVLLGIEHEDGQDDAKYLIQKLTQLRIFSDADGKMNLSVQDVNGGILSPVVVSVFRTIRIATY
jgi:hypothetical protein